MLRGVRVSEKFPYICEGDDAPGDTHEERVRNGATVFWLGTLPVDLRTKIEDGLVGFVDAASGASQTASLRVNTARQNLEALRFGLKGFENFQDPDGNQIKFETEKVSLDGRTYDAVTLECLAHFDTRVINELGGQVRRANAVSAVERKN